MFFRTRIPPIGALIDEFKWVQEKLGHLESPLVFSHNDLLLGNILHEQGAHSVHFIDFEYAGPNYQAYDIANHFCEFAGAVNVLKS